MYASSTHYPVDGQFQDSKVILVLGGVHVYVHVCVYPCIQYKCIVYVCKVYVQRMHIAICLCGHACTYI